MKSLCVNTSADRIQVMIPRHTLCLPLRISKYVYIFLSARQKLKYKINNITECQPSVFSITEYKLAYKLYTLELRTELREVFI